MDNAEYQAALLADGWQAAPIYPREGHREYDPGRSAKFTRDGFLVTFYRKADSLSDARHAYGPDSLALELPASYDFAQMQDNLRKCGECGAVGDTVSLGFAGRVCPECRAKLVPTVEYPGWTN
jgi:hypothetical protein